MTRTWIDWFYSTVHMKDEVLRNIFEGLFRTPSDRISHRIHVVRVSSSQLPAKSELRNPHTVQVLLAARNDCHNVLFFFVGRGKLPWYCGLRAWRRHCDKRVRTPLAVLHSHSDEYTWERYVRTHPLPTLCADLHQYCSSTRTNLALKNL